MKPKTVWDPSEPAAIFMKITIRMGALIDCDTIFYLCVVCSASLAMSSAFLSAPVRRRHIPQRHLRG
jgi:hypothetical protein